MRSTCLLVFTLFLVITPIAGGAAMLTRSSSASADLPDSAAFEQILQENRAKDEQIRALGKQLFTKDKQIRDLEEALEDGHEKDLQLLTGTCS